MLTSLLFHSKRAFGSYFGVTDSERTEEEQKMLRQILVDVPRTAPGIPLFHNTKVSRILERVLYIWAIRHPASGYVQGMNDFALPFFVVFLSPHVGKSDKKQLTGSLLVPTHDLNF